MCRSQGLEVGEGTASTNRSRQLPTVAEDTPCRRAASASDNSPFNTANTTWICSSTDTCRDGFCCLLTQPSFPTPQLNPLPESLTHSRSKEAIALRMAGVPRVAAEGLATHWRDADREPESFDRIRQWLSDLRSGDWDDALPADSELTGQECRQVWEALAGIQ
jgi:hypothetical protein